jgi:phosphate transport system substrate-binding protein
MMNLVRKISIVMWMISLLTFAAAFPVSAAELIRVVGSDSMAHTVTVYATEFATNHPDCSVLVSGGETGTGWERIVSGEAEIAMLSERPSKKQLDEAKAKGANIEEAVVGWGGIVFITHPSNPVESLTVDQVSKLLTGQYNNWKQVGGPEKPVQVITASEQVRAGTAHFILEEVAKGSLAPSARQVAYFRSVPPTVAETEGSLGLIRMRNLERLIEQNQEKRIKVISIKKDEQSPAIAPSRESIDEGFYPITRPYLLCVNPNGVSSCSMSFFKFCGARNPRPGAKK